MIKKFIVGVTMLLTSLHADEIPSFNVKNWNGKMHLDSDGNSFYKKNKGMVQGKLLKMAKEPAANLNTPNFLLRLTVENYHNETSLILRIFLKDGKHYLIIKRLAFSGRESGKIDLEGKIELKEKTVDMILKKTDTEEMKYLTTFGLNDRLSPFMGSAYYSLEYYGKGAYNVIDWSDLTGFNIVRFGEFRPKWVKPLEKYKEFINDLLSVALLKKISC